MDDCVKVILVEDEEIILNTLKKIIDWDSLGFRICGTASSYDDAVALAKTERPDLMISDIMLGSQQQTGIDLVKLFSTLLPQMKTILLTGYDSFEFAQDAIGYTVKAYLLKPVDVNILKKKLSEIREEFICQWQEENARKALNLQLDRARPFLFYWFVSCSEQERNDSMASLIENQSGWQPVIVRFQETTPTQELYEMFLKIEDMYKQRNTDVLPFFNSNHYIFVLRMAAKEELCNGSDVNVFVQGLQDYFDFRERQDYIIGVGRYVEDLSVLQESYLQAYTVSGYGEFVGGSRQVYYTDLSVAHQSLIPRIQSVRVEISLAIQTANHRKAIALVHRIIRDAAEQGASKSILRSLAFESLVILNEIITQVGLNYETCKVPDWAYLDSCTNIDEILECISRDYTKVGEDVERQRSERNYLALEQVKHLIDTRYSDNLSLESMAKIAFMSPTYLSSQFSERYGTTFKNYLIKVRVEAAKILLSEGVQKVYEVAETVGYNDIRYFSQVFRKHTGMTPLQYRKQCNEAGINE
jgi:two-component system response regulator YesN